MRQAIGPTLIASVTLLAAAGVDAGGLRVAAGTPGVLAAPADWGTAPDASVTAQARRPNSTSASRSAIVETRSGDARPVRPVVDLPASPLITERRLGPGSRLVILGNSFSSGWNGAGLGAHGWPAILAKTRGWSATNLAVPGTGFENPGWTSQPIGSRVAAAIAAQPDVLVVAGGHNDSRWSVAATSAAADRVLARLRRALPDATILIVAPIWRDGSPPARCLALRDHLRRSAAALGAVFVDPLTDRWFAGSRHALIGPDGLHPTDDGHRFIARAMLAALAGR